MFAAIAAGYARNYSLTPAVAAGIYAAFLAQLILAIAPSFIATRWTPLLLPAPYLFYAIGTGDWNPLAILKLCCVAALPIVIYRLFPVRQLERPSWQDGIVAAFLIAVVLSGALRGIWRVPRNLDFIGRLFLLGVGAWCWSTVRPVPGLGFDFKLSAAVVRRAATNFLYFAVIAIPLSLWLGFTRPHLLWRGTPHFLTDFLEIFLFIALLEELFFRGFLQNLLGQAAASCLFGLFHMLHAPFPNWRYVLLATIAGWFYGSAFRESGSMLSSALVHAAVDTTWRTFLSS